MPTTPRARTRIEPNAGAPALGLEFIIIFAAVAQNADFTPRVFAGSDSALALHGYNDGVEFASHYVEDTGKSFIFMPLPIATAGVIGRQNATGNSGTSVVSIAAGGSGPLCETDGILKVKTGGVIGTDQIALLLSLDGGRTYKPVRLGTATSYAIPLVGLTLSFGAGELVADDVVLEWHTTAPRWDQAGLQAGRTALAAQLKGAREWMVIGDLLEEDDATDVVTQANAYETSHDRFVFARAQVRDRLPLAEMSQLQVRMTGDPTLTFDMGDGTVTRSAGSWITEGFVVGDIATIDGSEDNNVTGAITALTATVMTLGDTVLADEAAVADCTVVGTPGLTFDAGDKTVVRNRGSWLNDGFAVGDSVTIAGTEDNDLTGAATAVTATTLTLGGSAIADELIGSFGVSITAGETKAQWIAEMDAEFADIDAQKRIDLGLGRARKMSPLSGWRFRRPAQWPVAIREFQHDVHIPTWRKADGPLDGWDLEDEDGNLAEFDQRVDGGGLEGRFTCLRTWGNGPAGTFVAMSLTRAQEGDALQFTHNMAVANVACTVCQAATENAIGQVLQVDNQGHGTRDSLNKIESLVNSALEDELLVDKKNEGARASSAKWVANTGDDLSTVDATLTGVLSLRLNGTLVNIDTKVRINPNAG